MSIRFTFYGLVLLLLLFTGCQEEGPNEPKEYQLIIPENPVDRGSRLFGINISESNAGFEDTFLKARQAGTEVVELNIPWSAIEESQGNYQDPWGGVLAATAFYAQHDIKVIFSIALINTVAWEVPDYLSEVSPASAQFIYAFLNMMDWFLANIPEQLEVAAISIGNEVDLVLDSDQEWQSYQDFYRIVSQDLKQKYPGLKIGVKTTVMNGVFGLEKQKLKLINQYSDLVMLNYYPQNEFFQVKDPKSVIQDFNLIAAAFPEQEIWMTEVGYQSGNLHCASNETKQAQFYHHLFKAWDQHRDHITAIQINWLHDQSPEIIDEWKDYYGDDPALVEYLSTLGLRHFNNTDKPAWLQLKQEVQARGW